MTTGGAVVTGAGGGLGREIALRLGGLGYTVHVTDVDESLAQAVAAEVGNGAFASAYDVRDAQAARDLADRTVQQAGSLALWVNNAGVLFTGPMWEQSQETRQLMFDVNVLGTTHGMAAALAIMATAGTGHVVNIVSLAGLSAVPGEAVYSGTKHAIMGLSVSTMLDLRTAGLRDVHVSCICPDGMWTPMLFDKLDDPGASMSFSGVLLQPGDVADAVARVVQRPKPVTPVPAWRGVMARTFDLSRHGSPCSAGRWS
ncbi:MAG: short-chain dehydrogenase [Nocardioidaceae bacterium]|nr:short-chain dehydrogenase [Nocardioidaceae bacterium]